MSSTSPLPLKTRSLVLERLRNLVRRARAFCRDATSDELRRSFLMVFVLRPAADLLSRERALRVARWCGSLVPRFPASGISPCRTMERCFGMQGTEALEASRECLAQLPCTFTIFRRILRGRENLDDWRIEERNSQGVVQLRESGQSFIVATGHFRRESFYALHLPRICPGSIISISDPFPARSLHPRAIQTRVQFGQISEVMRRIRPDIRFAFIGDPSILETLEYLKRPGCQMIVAVDAFWHRIGRFAFTRPFAGMRAQGFSMGSAVYSRLAQCPIVACATYVGNDGTIVLEWGPVIPPPQRNDEAADRRTTNALLDFMEGAIGQRPTQYVLYIGEERRWNSAQQTWEDPPRNDQLPDIPGAAVQRISSNLYEQADEMTTGNIVDRYALSPTQRGI